MRETWYVLETGDVADPRDIVHGVEPLKHKDGRAVAMRDDGVTPRSRSVDVDAERAKAADAVKPKAREAKPAEPKTGYTTREAKAG